MGSVTNNRDRRCESALQGEPCRCAKGKLGQHTLSRAASYKICGQTLLEWIAPGVCMCCGEALGRGWCLDHDHATGYARGVVCRRCNIAAAYFEDASYRQLVMKYVAAGGPVGRKASGTVFLAANGAWRGTIELPRGADGKRRRQTVEGQTREIVEKKLHAARKKQAAKAAVAFGASLRASA